MLRQALQALLFAAALLASGAAHATEICVSCSGPEAVYRCTVDQSADVEAYRYGKRVLQFVCITELARQGNHGKCRVQRGEGACIGIERSVALTAPLESEGAAVTPETPEADSLDAAQQPQEEPKSGPPKTVEELARRTASSSKEQFQKTGDAVGGAMKKSWDCLKSWFTQC